MKNIRKIFIITIILLVSIFVFVGCDNKKGSNEFIDIDNNEKVNEYTAYNIRDFHIKKGINEYDFLQDIYLVDSYDEIYYPTCDSSNVDFGRKGEYEIKYTYDNWSQIKKVYVYDIPTIDFETEKLVLDYIGASYHLNDGVKATDSFNNTIDVMYIEEESSVFGESGLLNYGTNEIVYAVKDKAGNIIKKKRSITINKDKNTPTTSLQENKLVVDVVDDKIELNIDTKKEKIVLTSFNNKILDDVKYNNNLLSFDFNQLSQFNIGDNKLTIATEKGYININIFITDNKEPQFDLETMSSTFYCENTNNEVPKIINKYDRQKLEYNISILDNEGNKIDINNGFFKTNGAGEYTFKSEVLRNNEKTTELEYKFNVYSNSDYKEKLAKWNKKSHDTDTFDLTNEHYIFIGDEFYNYNGACVKIINPNESEFISDKQYISFEIRTQTNIPYIVVGQNNNERKYALNDALLSNDNIKFYDTKNNVINKFTNECKVVIKLNKGDYVRFSNTAAWCDYFIKNVEFINELPKQKEILPSSWDDKSNLTDEHYIFIGDEHYNYNGACKKILDQNGNEYLSDKQFVSFTLRSQTNVPYIVVGKQENERKYALEATLNSTEEIQFFNSENGNKLDSFVSGCKIVIKLNKGDYVRFSNTAAWCDYFVKNIEFYN